MNPTRSSRPVRASTVLLTTLLLSLLAACGGPSRRPDEAATATPPGTSKPAPYVLKRGGGFYLDDGPGDNPPADLDAIPDAVPRAEPPHRYANRPYNVLGRNYVPLKPGTPYRARGVASWYGRRFHGQKTSTGETYDMYAMTAAHPTLPLPSYARVTNPATGRSVVVRVNDRGPFLHDRLIDLSYVAAWKLGYADGGSTTVVVESIGADGTPGDAPATRATKTEFVPPAPLPEVSDGRGIYLQLGAFSNLDNADNLRSRLVRELGALGDRLVVHTEGGISRVQLGPWRDHAEARRIADQMAELLDTRPVVVQR